MDRHIWFLCNAQPFGSEIKKVSSVDIYFYEGRLSI
uniref:Uncharacterized protein n=1 Tax=Manihot esculenta TaxID=3983 RepID=A0A2C9U0W6_MANES